MYCILYNTTYLQNQLYWSTIVQCTVNIPYYTLKNPIILEYNCTMTLHYKLLYTYKPNYTGVQLYNVLFTINYYTLTNPIILWYNCTMCCSLCNTTHLQTQLYWSKIVQCTYSIQYYTLKNPIMLEYNSTMYCILYNTTHLQTQLFWSTTVQCTVHYKLLHTYKPNYTELQLYNVQLIQSYAYTV